jgi:hypothetical protein
MIGTITAILYAMACASCTPEPQAIYLTAEGPAICFATAAAQNVELTGTNIRYYCDGDEK